jgi:hypothetical protein
MAWAIVEEYAICSDHVVVFSAFVFKARVYLCVLLSWIEVLSLDLWSSTEVLSEYGCCISAKIEKFIQECEDSQEQDLMSYIG